MILWRAAVPQKHGPARSPRWAAQESQPKGSSLSGSAAGSCAAAGPIPAVTCRAKLCSLKKATPTTAVREVAGGGCASSWSACSGTARLLGRTSSPSLDAKHLTRLRLELLGSSVAVLGSVSKTN